MPANDVKQEKLSTAQLGQVPPEVESFRVAKREGKSWRFMHHDDGGDVLTSEWPVALLKAKGLGMLRQWWGGGQYVIHWIGQREGKRGPMGKSRPVMVKEEKPAAGAAAAAEAAPLGGAGTAVLSAVAEGGGTVRDALMMLQLMGQEQEARHRREMERLQLQAQNQLAMQQTFFTNMFRLQREASGPVGVPSVDLSPVLSKLEELGGRLDELEDEYDDDGPDSSAPPPWLGQIINMVKGAQHKRDEVDSQTTRSVANGTHGSRASGAGKTGSGGSGKQGGKRKAK